MTPPFSRVHENSTVRRIARICVVVVLGCMPGTVAWSHDDVVRDHEHSEQPSTPHTHDAGLNQEPPAYDKVIRAAVIPDLPPVYTKDAEGRPAGFAIDVIAASCSSPRRKWSG